jgi:glutathione S-transferase
VHRVRRGLSALEAHLAGHPATGRFCHGDTPTLADACVAPQLANARRAGLPFDDRPTLDRIHGACRPLPAFERAAPERQPDAPSG